MRKLFFLLVLVSGMLTAQTPNATNTQTIGKFLKLSKVSSGLETDNVLVRGTDGIVKFVPRSEFGGGSQVNADWNATSGPSEIFNKPIIPTVVPQVNTDWNAVSGLSQLLNKPQFRTINGQSIFGSTDLTISGGTSIAHLEFDNTDKTIWNNGKLANVQNCVFGQGVLRANIGANNTTGFGAYALYNITTASNNVAVGMGALFNNTTGDTNVAVGLNAGTYWGSNGVNSLTTDSIYIGANSAAQANGQTNQIVIGTSTIGGGSNTVTLGNQNITRTILGGVIQKRVLDTAPASATAPGTVGEIRITATHVYWCIATNTWIRAAGTTW